MVWLGIAASRTLYGNTLNLALVGALYAVLFSLGIYLIVRGLRLHAISIPFLVSLCAIGVLAFTDISYTAYFNSFYGEPSSYAFLFLAVGAVLNVTAAKRPNYGMLAVLVLAASLFSASKTQDLPLIILIAAFVVALAWLHADVRWQIAVALSALIMIGTATATYVATPQDEMQVNVYNAVFVGILEGESQPQAERDLIDLGAQPAYVAFAGTTYYSEAAQKVVGRADFVRDFYGHVSFGTIIRFYLVHPDHLVRALDMSAQAAAVTRPTYLGSFLQSDGKPACQHVPQGNDYVGVPAEPSRQALCAQADQLTLWSSLRQTILPRSIWGLLVYFALYFAFIIRAFAAAKDRRAQAGVGVLALIGLLAVIELPISYVAEGANELVKHLFLFDVLFDMTLVVTGAWLLALCVTPLLRLPLLARWARRPASDAIGPSAPAMPARCSR